MRFQAQLVFAALVLSVAGVCAFNVTEVLAPFPEYTTFSQALVSTGVDKEIDATKSVTLFVLRSLPGGYTPEEVADILRYHVIPQALSDSDIRHLNHETALFTTLYQRTGRTQSGFVKVTNLPDGTTGVGLQLDAPPNATIVRNVTRQGYNISVFEISSPLVPLNLQQSAITNVTSALVSGGEYTTLITLLQSTGLDGTVQDLATKGLTLFAPTDSAFNKIRNKLSTLTREQVILVLTYHVVPRYISYASLLAANQVETTASGYTFFLTNVAGRPTVQTGIVHSTEQTTITDKEPAAIYAIDTVLIPEALFAPVPSPLPPAPRDPSFTDALVSALSGGQYTTLIALLQSIEVLDVITIFQDLGTKGLTLFAPTDSAFSNIRNTMSTLTVEQVKLVLLYHVVPRYISQASLLAADQVETTASGCTFFLTNVAGRPTVRTGIVNSTVQATIFDKEPAALYTIDTVLIPEALFAPVPPPGPAPVSSPLAPLAPRAPAPLAPLGPLAPAPLAPLAPLAPIPVAPVSPLSQVPEAPLAPTPVAHTPRSVTPTPPTATTPGSRSPTPAPDNVDGGESGDSALGVSFVIMSSALLASSILLL